MKEGNEIKTTRTMKDNELSKRLVEELQIRRDLEKSVLREKQLAEEKYVNEVKLKEIAETKLKTYESVFSDENFSSEEIKAAKKEAWLPILLIIGAIFLSGLACYFGADYIRNLESRIEYENRTCVLSKPLEDARLEIQKSDFPDKQDLLIKIDALLKFELDKQATTTKQREDIRREANLSWYFSLGGGLLSACVAFYFFLLSSGICSKTHWFNKLSTYYRVALYYIPLIISFISFVVFALYSWEFKDVIKLWGLFYLSLGVAGLLFPYVLPKYKENRDKKELEKKLNDNLLLANKADLESMNVEEIKQNKTLVNVEVKNNKA